ncbi:MAG: hypothetical protein IJN12_02310 [Clostridia bacterium]|nr:hypothetical protein [Clostridia bacterium]
MLGKLLKYEFKSAAKIMVLFYIALIALSAIFSVTYALSENINAETNTDSIIEQDFINNVYETSAAISLSLFYFMIIAVSLLTVSYSINRFQHTVLGPEGYLTHTLPVKTRDIILSKAINAIIWQIFSFIAVCISLLIIFAAQNDLFAFFKKVIESIEYNAEVIITVLELILLSLVTSISTYFQIFASMSIGYSANKHRRFKSIGVFILIYWIESSIFSLLLYSDIISVIMSLDRPISLLFVILLFVLLSMVFYLITHHFLKKKLNLL